MRNDFVLKMENICKGFPGVMALNNMNLSLGQGEILGLVGENGAGKSTLIKVLSGAYAPDSGTITLNGENFSAMTPAKAIEKGVSVIYQELNLVPQLSIYENVFLGNEPNKGGFVDKQTMAEETKVILDSLGIDLDPGTQVRKLSVAYRQLIEVAKAVARHAKVLVLDEPTSSLSNSEANNLFRIIGSLKQKGVSMIYVSHRMEEIFMLCDRVTVMRDGELVKTVDASAVTREDLIGMMVGRTITETYPERENAVGDETVLQIDHLKGSQVNDVSFKIRKGEILGFAGLVGAGRTEMVRTLFGAERKSGGEIILNGKKVSITKPVDAIQNGIGLIPEDRKQQGLNLKGSISENISLPNLDQLQGRLLLSSRKERVLVDKYIQYLSIRTPSSKKTAGHLSGGNQQKVVLAKWLAKNCKVLILDEPTRGIDVGSKQEIYKLMRSLTDQGISILMISSEMPELMGMSDRILVMYKYQIKGELLRNEFSQEKILDIASGGKQ
jgi:ribose transport system ATP-binding protein